MQFLFASLSEYIPIIQLFIGNGPLVFLQKKFENPSTSSHDILTDKYQKFFNTNQAALPNQEFHFNTILKYDKDWLKNTGNSVITLAISSFVYCILLMFYAIGEQNFDIELVAGSLFVVTVLYFIYNAVILIFFGRDSIQSLRDWKGRWCVSTILALILCFFSKSGWHVTDWMPIYIVNILALSGGFVGIIAVWVGIFLRNRFLCQRLSCMEELSQQMDTIIKLRKEILESVDSKLDNKIIEEIRNFVPLLSEQARNELLIETIETGLKKNKILETLDGEIASIYNVLIGKPLGWWYRSYSIE